jgi:hypothetical protein
VAHSETEQEAPARVVGQQPLGVGGDAGQAAEDAGHAGGDDTAFRGVEQHPGVRDRLATDGLGYPQRTEAQLVELRSRFACPHRWLQVELGGPNAHAPDVHGRRRYFGRG